MKTSHDNTKELNAYLFMPEDLRVRFEEVGSQDLDENPLVVAKYFNPMGSQTWYAIAYYPDQHICYGYVTGMFVDEFGYFSLQELEDLKHAGIRIERDLYFSEVRFKSLIK